MTPPKLSESEKIEIVDLYRETEENTITLAERFSVSSSTVRRLLQSSLSEDEYKTLVQQKQKRSVQSTDLPEELPTEKLPNKVRGKKRQKNQEVAETIDDRDDMEEVAPVVSKRRRQTSKKAKLEIVEELESANLPEDGHVRKRRSKKASVANSALIDPIAELPISPKDLVEMFDLEVSQNQTFADFDDAFDDAEDDDGLDSFSDDHDEDGELGEVLPVNASGNFGLSFSHNQQSLIQILPLSVAILPRTCYLVVDRFAELVTKPLMAFAELGHIPPEEIQEKTLPIFDNHRVAKRFSERNQKVLKVPDGKVFAKTISHLRKKGITRFLIDGRVYYF